MKTICFYNRKGGTGKTSTAINVGGCLEKYHKKKVLIIDCDSQGNTTDYLLDKDEIGKTLEDYLIDNVENVNEIIYPVLFAEEENSKIKVVPTSPSIDSHNIQDVYKLKEFLQAVEKDYDYCLIDCTPYLAPMTLMGFCACQYIITITELDTDGVNGYNLLIDEINNVKEKGYNDTLELLGLVANKVVWNDSVGNYILESFRNNASDSIFKSTVRSSLTIKQARFFGKPVCYYKPKTNVNDDYRNLTREILKRIGDM